MMKSKEFIIKNYNEGILKKKFSRYVLGVDIGGTNTNMAVGGIKDLKPILLFSLHFKTKELNSITPAIKKTLDYAQKKYSIKVDSACIGAAGVVSPDDKSVKLTNAHWDIDINKIQESTGLHEIFLINDFQTIGYGINLLNPKNKEDIIQVKAGSKKLNSYKSTKAILGAGTGLGKSILTYDQDFKAYIPLPSEGGHGDFPAQNNFEIQLSEYIKKINNTSKHLTYEELLSGRGIENIYSFLIKTKDLEKTNYTKEIDNAMEKASIISKYKNDDETCKKTFELFTLFYARCAKNFALDTLATGGLYIAGGIASKNKEIFSTKIFKDEFENAYRRVDVLRSIPIFIILNYNVSLYGACFAAMYQSYKIKK